MLRHAKPVLFLGENPVGSAPLRTLAKALGRYGIQPSFAEGAEYGSVLGWMRTIRAHAALILTQYDVLELFYLRQLALAGVAGRPLVRWWVGTDVLQCLEHEPIRRTAAELDRFVALNIAVAPHLVEELASIGIVAEFVPSVLEEDPADIPVQGAADELRVLIYLPSVRADFYCGDLMRRVVAANTDLQFVVVGDPGHGLGGHANVESLGWVEDMATVWPRVGCLLRITRHDGLPRMVLDALLRGKHVIYSWPLDGCRLAKGFDDVQQQLAAVRTAPYPHKEGTRVVRRMLSPDPAEVYAQRLKTVRWHYSLRPRLRSLMAAIRLTRRLKLQTASGTV